MSLIYIDSKQCDGCGICVDTCPVGAIVLRADKAFVEQELCEGCQVCMESCPRGAILLIEQLDTIGNAAAESRPMPMPAPDVEVLPAAPQRPASTSVGVAIGSAVVGVLPRLASLAVDWLERRPRSIEESSTATTESSVERNSFNRAGGRGSQNGRGQRQRRRGKGSGRGSGRGKNRR